MSKAKPKELNANNLKEILWKTLNEVRAKKIDVSTANAVSQASKEIMSVINTEIRIAQIAPAGLASFTSLPQLKGAKR